MTVGHDEWPGPPVQDPVDDLSQRNVASDWTVARVEQQRALATDEQIQERSLGARALVLAKDEEAG
jgi:hypothetical protein